VKKALRFLKDLALSFTGLAVMNAVLSLLCYPLLERRLGSAMQGKVLFFTAIMTLMASALGGGANYGRMKDYAEERKTVNGDYNIFLLFSGLLTVPVTLFAIALKGDSAGSSAVEIMLLIFLTVVRMYGDVEYRLNLNYGRFSLYYTVIAAGYGLGLILFLLTGRWALIFIIGELSGILFVGFTGQVFRRPFFRRSEGFKSHFLTSMKLSGAYFLSDFVASADRLLFPLLLVNGDEMTSLFYYASVVGKLMSLLSTPLNGVLTGYIAKREDGLKRRQFLMILVTMLGVWAAVTGVAVLGSRIFVGLFYHDYLETVKPLFLIANAGQVIFFICNTLMVVVLRYTNPKYQVIVSALYLLCFFGITVPLILNRGLYGMAYGILTVNILKFILFGLVGLFAITGGKKGGYESEISSEK